MPNAKVEFKLDEFDVTALGVGRPNWPRRIHRDTKMIGSNNFPSHMYPRLQRNKFIGV